MQQIFVLEIGKDDDPNASVEGAGIGRKRRRALSSREGEEVSSLYGEIIRPRERDYLNVSRDDRAMIVCSGFWMNGRLRPPPTGT